jgi:hypothetical protein
MTAGEQIAGVAVGGHPRTTRRVVYELAPTVCPACLTDQRTDVCPTDCPSREDQQR